MNIIEQLKFDSDGLIPAIAQEEKSGEILMMAWMNRESLRATIETNRATYWSRSRKKFWMKGEESGNIQEIRSIHIDCDGDAVLLKVNQIGGAACHTGHRTCFYREVVDGGQNFKESNTLFLTRTRSTGSKREANDHRHLCLDVIHRYDGTEKKGYGGIYFAVAAMANIASDADTIFRYSASVRKNLTRSGSYWRSIQT